nr:MAG TPA: Protein of unknown function (DUF1642) [Caudoviricetes sp.]
MNVKKLIKKFEERKTIIGNFQGYAVWWEDVKEILEQLDEPEKVTIPQFVADWIEVCKNSLIFNLKSAMNLNTIMRYSEDKHTLIDWIKVNSNQETFALAWILGYEVEEEKRYRISMPKARNYKNHAQFLCEKDGKMFWCAEWHRFRTKFTRKELEAAGFGWVFDCPGFEIEEVE